MAKEDNTTIMIHKETHKRLKGFGVFQESYNGLLNRLMDNYVKDKKP
jgi:hypothetical protein